MKEYEFNMSFDEHDLAELKEFINSEKFARFLLSNVTSFSVCVLILQTLLEKAEELEQLM